MRTCVHWSTGLCGRGGRERGEWGLDLGLSIHLQRPLRSSPDPGLVEQSGHSREMPQGKWLRTCPSLSAHRTSQGSSLEHSIQSPVTISFPSQTAMGPRGKEDECLVQALNSRGSDLSVQNTAAPFSLTIGWETSFPNPMCIIKNRQKRTRRHNN